MSPSCTYLWRISYRSPLSNSLVSAGCRTLSYGGAVYVNTAKNITFRKTDFRRNYVALVGATGNGKAHGAALYATRASVLLDSCTLVSNQALNSGYNAFSYGAVYAMEVYRLKLLACTLLNNNANKAQVRCIVRLPCLFRPRMGARLGLVGPNYQPCLTHDAAGIMHLTCTCYHFVSTVSRCSVCIWLAKWWHRHLSSLCESLHHPRTRNKCESISSMLPRQSRPLEQRFVKRVID